MPCHEIYVAFRTFVGMNPILPIGDLKNVIINPELEQFRADNILRDLYTLLHESTNRSQIRRIRQ